MEKREGMDGKKEEDRPILVYLLASSSKRQAGETVAEAVKLLLWHLWSWNLDRVKEKIHEDCCGWDFATLAANLRLNPGVIRRWMQSHAI